MIQLTNHQTLELLYQEKRRNAFRNKYKYTTKLQWYCLKCLKPIFLSFKQYNRNNIFCSDCFKASIPLTIVQLQYMRIAKEKQINLIENFINNGKQDI